MHHIIHYAQALSQLPQAYKAHSQGYTRIALADHTVGAVHTSLGLCRLEASGVLDLHVHFYEEAFYILEGQVLVSIDGRNYQLGPGDYGIIQASVPHAWRGIGDQPVRWLEMLSPQPKPAGLERDTFFFKGRAAPIEGQPPDWRDPTTRYLGHFEDAQMPPASQLQMDGYRGGNIYGISLKMLVDRMLGAQHLTLFMVEFQPGGDGNVHDHPFEETYFFLSGEADALLDGKPYHIKAGDCVWTGVGSTHGFFNRGNVPVRWIETQSPQPPGQQAFRFPADWVYLSKKLGIEDD